MQMSSSGFSEEVLAMRLDLLAGTARQSPVLPAMLSSSKVISACPSTTKSTWSLPSRWQKPSSSAGGSSTTVNCPQLPVKYQERSMHAERIVLCVPANEGDG